jgi:hypothetical protein
VGILLRAGRGVGDIPKDFVPFDVCSKKPSEAESVRTGSITGIVGFPI